MDQPVCTYCRKKCMPLGLNLFLSIPWSGRRWCVALRGRPDRHLRRGGMSPWRWQAGSRWRWGCINDYGYAGSNILAPTLDNSLELCVISYRIEVLVSLPSYRLHLLWRVELATRSKFFTFYWKLEDPSFYKIVNVTVVVFVSLLLSPVHWKKSS